MTAIDKKNKITGDARDTGLQHSLKEILRMRSRGCSCMSAYATTPHSPIHSHKSGTMVDTFGGIKALFDTISDNDLAPNSRFMASSSCCRLVAWIVIMWFAGEGGILGIDSREISPYLD
jgi:hypothetical protein